MEYFRKHLEKKKNRKKGWNSAVSIIHIAVRVRVLSCFFSRQASVGSALNYRLWESQMLARVTVDTEWA